MGNDWGKEPEQEWGTLLYEENGVDIKQRIETLPGNYNIFYDNVHGAVRNGAELYVKPEETLEVLKIIEACVVSNREKRTVIL
jgi:predicted dehydrogenase